MEHKTYLLKNPLFLVSPNSGKLTKKEKLSHVESCFSKPNSKIVIPKSPNETERISREAFQKNRLVVACGGDGFVNLVANQAIKEKGTMSVLPLGRGNDFAKSIGILRSDDLKRAFENPRFIRSDYLDLSFNDKQRVCLTSAGIGLLSEAAFRASKMPFLQGSLLYALSALACFVNLKTHMYDIDFGNKIGIKERLVILVAACRPYAGGGMHIAPEAGKYKNKMNLLYASKVSRLEAIGLLEKVLGGRHLNHPKVKNAHYSNCKISTTDKNFWAPLVYGDGEHLGNLPVKISVGKSDLTLLIPNLP